MTIYRQIFCLYIIGASVGLRILWIAFDSKNVAGTICLRGRW
jgi:hypothetical protein